MTRFNQALAMATQAHGNQIRKGTENTLGMAVPYITHPVAVSALVVRHGGTEDQAIAALLHDVLEDGGPQWAEPIQIQFGSNVLSIVQACTDGVPDETGEKPPWAERKQAYIAHLASAGADVLLVSGCDKLSNAKAVLEDLVAIGPAVFERFKAKKEGTLWYYAEVSKILTTAHAPMAQQLAQTVAEIRVLAEKA